MTADERYWELLEKLLDEARTRNAELIAAAAEILETRLAQGGLWYAFGTGHGHLLALEIFYRAGGAVRVLPVLDPPLMLHVGAAESSRLEREEGRAKRLLDRYPISGRDVMLVASNSGRNATSVEMALEAKRRGALVIALTSLKHSRSVAPRNSIGKRLFEVADIVLDNCGVIGDAAVDVGDGWRSGATSTAIGAAILQAIVARVHEIAVQRGDRVDFFASANVDGGDEHNEKLVTAIRPDVPFI